MAAIGPECVKTLRQNWSVRVYVKSEIYRHVSRCGFRVEARFPIQFWVPVALKNVFTQPRPIAAARENLYTWLECVSCRGCLIGVGGAYISVSPSMLTYLHLLCVGVDVCRPSADSDQQDAALDHPIHWAPFWQMRMVRLTRGRGFTRGKKWCHYGTSHERWPNLAVPIFSKLICSIY